MPKKAIQLAKRRDPAWHLPDRPDSPVYAELLKEIGPTGDPAALTPGRRELFRQACLNDFWFFCRHQLLLGEFLIDDPYLPGYREKPWIEHPWLFDRCRMVQESPDGQLDLWPRFFFKTTIVTQALTLWDLVDNPELRVAIITYKLDKTGEAFLGGIITECVRNPKLLGAFPEVFWSDPEKQAPLWTRHAITLKRRGHPREPTLCAFGLSGIHTSMHFDIRIWDDIVVERSVSSKDQIETTTQAWRNAEGIAGSYTRDRMVGTHWSPGDTYSHILDIKAAKLRLFTPFDEDGKPVFRSKEWLEERRHRMGRFNWHAQMMNDPKSASEGGFDPQWWKIYEGVDLDELRSNLLVYILVDTAAGRKSIAKAARDQVHDYTVMWVVGLGQATTNQPGPIYILDLIRDRMSLPKTTEVLFDLITRWDPSSVIVEAVGAARDDQHFRMIAMQRGMWVNFRIVDEKVPKESRIVRLQAPLANGNILFPRELWGDMDGQKVDLMRVFREKEYDDWTPSAGSRHDDMLDCLSWVASPKARNVLRYPRGVIGRSYSADQTDDRGRGMNAARSFWMM